jgi:hypothetical protein
MRISHCRIAVPANAVRLAYVVQTTAARSCTQVERCGSVRAIPLDRAAAMLLWVGLLAWTGSARADSAAEPTVAAQNVSAENVAPQNVSGQTELEEENAGQNGSGWSGSEGATLSHALSKGADTSTKGPPAKLFTWAIGNSELGQSLDTPEDPETDEIETDRPDFTQNRKTVGRGVVQLESGMTYLQGRKNSYNDFSFPETLLRIGVVADWLELRVSQSFASDRTNEVDGRSVGKTGAEDLVVGAKLALTAQRGWLPEMGMIVHTSIPTGSAGFMTPMMLPGLNWLYGWDITKRLSLAGSTQAYKTSDLVPLPTSRGGIAALDHVQHSFLVVAQSFSMEYELTDKLSPYFEWFALFPSGAMDPTKNPQHYLDTGFTYKVTPNIQLDARAGMGLSPYSTALFAGSGLSVRF